MRETVIAQREGTGRTLPVCSKLVRFSALRFLLSPLRIASMSGHFRSAEGGVRPDKSVIVSFDGVCGFRCLVPELVAEGTTA